MFRFIIIILISIGTLTAGEKIDILKEKCHQKQLNEDNTFYSSMACETLADIYYFKYLKHGISKQNPSKAFKYYKMACDASPKYRFDSCSNVAEMYLKGDGVELNLPAAYQYASEACEFVQATSQKGMRSAGCRILGNIYATQNSHFKAAKVFSIDCLLRSKAQKSCYDAIKHAKLSCEDWNAEACHLVGNLFQEAIKDPVEAQKFYNEGCKKGFNKSCHEAKVAMKKGVCSKNKIESGLNGTWKTDKGDKYITFFVQNNRQCIEKMKIYAEDEEAFEIIIKDGKFIAIDSYPADGAGTTSFYHKIFSSQDFNAKIVFQSSVSHIWDNLDDKPSSDLLYFYRE